MNWWFGIDLWKRVIAFLILGILVGAGAKYGDPSGAASQMIVDYIYPFGQAFVAAIKYLIVPLIVTSLVAGVLALGDPAKLGSIGVKAMILYSVTTIFAVTLGLILGSIIPMGMGMDASSFAAADEASQAAVSGKLDRAEAASFLSRYLQMDVIGNLQRPLSAGPILFAGVSMEVLVIIGLLIIALVAAGGLTASFLAFAGLIFLSIITWGVNPITLIIAAIILGLIILFTAGADGKVASAAQTLSEHVMRTTINLMEFAPIGVFALMAWVIATKGFAVLANLGLLALALYIACILQIIFVYGGLIKTVLKQKAMPFFRGVTDAQSVAFSTASSSSTLPVTIACATRNLGVDKSIASSVLPLGATINMDGTAIYLGLIGLFAAQALGIEMTLTMYAMVALTATLSSIGAAGIPSAGLLLATIVLEQIGIPFEQSVLIIAFIFPFDRLLDMMRTLTNVTGDLAVATTIAKWEDEIDLVEYAARDRV